MYCNICGKEFQPWVDIFHYIDERGNTPVLIYTYCDWGCESEYSYSFCIGCGSKIPKKGCPYCCPPCQNIFSGKITEPKKPIERIDRLPKNMNVYFFQIENNGPIKVGISQDPDERLKQIQTANPYKINFLFSFISDYAIENYIKENFKDTLLRGEWYKPSKKLLTLIKNLRIGKALNLSPKDLLI